MSKSITKIYEHLNLAINKAVKRSRFYPLPRDLGFEIEKPLLRKWAAGKTNLVEIGVFEGASAVTLRSAMSPDGTLHLIDPFIPDSMNKSLSARPFFAHLNVARISKGKVKWYRDYSQKIAKDWNQYIDFLFIDGDHNQDSCLCDWENWNKFVIKQGIVIFHDARHGSSNGDYWDGWEGPTNVVNRLFRGKEKLKHWTIVDEAGTAVVVQRIGE